MPNAATNPVSRVSARAKSKGPKMMTLQIEIGGHQPSILKTLKTRHRDVTKMLGDYFTTVTYADARGESAEMTFVVEPTKVVSTQADSYGDQLAMARTRGARLVAEILGDTAMLTSDAIGDLLGASRETVNQRRRAGELLGLEGATRGVRYPSWQLTDDGRLLPGLADVRRALGSDDWSVYRFLVEEHPELEGATGLQALKASRIEDAVLTADAIGRGSFA